MEYINKAKIAIEALPGRGLRKAVGKDSVFASNAMSVGYALYEKAYGVMEPHCHAEETIIVSNVKKGYMAWGEDKDNLTEKMVLEEGMVVHIPEGLWHVFTYDEGGFVEIIFIYGSTNNIRPEAK